MKLAESERFRKSFRGIAGSVAIILVSNRDGGVKGITCTSAASLSSDPPMIVICLDQKTDMIPLIRDADAFSVNYLAHGYEFLARAFTDRDGRLDEVAPRIVTGRSGEPVLGSGTCSVLECKVAAIYPGGDHSIISGFVQHGRFQSDAAPLLYGAGRYGAFSTNA
jgi:flavin reductase (DIM6/NTAB) family NADH-FMN oxidoreductase RutF